MDVSNLNPLLLLLFWLGVVCCVVAQVEIVRSSLKAHVGREAGSDAPVAATGRRWTEIVWTVAPAIGLGIVLVATWSAIRAHQGDSSDGSVNRPAAVIQRAS